MKTEGTPDREPSPWSEKKISEINMDGKVLNQRRRGPRCNSVWRPAWHYAGVEYVQTVLKWALLLALAVVPTAWAFDVSRIPTPQDLQQIRTQGWAASADEIEGQLMAAWKPSDFAQVGSTRSDIFRRWQLLGQWCRLLGTPEPEILRNFLGRRVVENPEKERTLLVVPPGMPLPADRSGRPLPTAAEHLGTGSPPADILQAFFPEDYSLQQGEVARRAHEGFLIGLAADPGFLAEFFRNLTSDDFVPVVLTRLEQLHDAHPTRWPQYRSLMLAFALVYDQRPPKFWPHHQVDPARVPGMDESLADRFEYYARANDTGKLEHDLRRLSVAELKYIVDAPIPRAELEWAAKNVRARRNQFERAFTAVNYDNRRIQRGQFEWPEDKGRYNLANIELWGGICVDQAYFAAIAGKAKGIPTLFFTGQGNDGGHAWFGYLRSPEGKWDLDAGRYINQNFTVGSALDPQTWLPVSDHELLYLSGKANRSPYQDAALGDLAMAKLFARRADLARRLAATQSALNSAPDFPPAWDARESALEAADDQPGLRAFYTAAIDKFRSVTDLKVRYQARLADFERASGDTRVASQLEQQMVSQNRRGRADLSSVAGAENLSRLVEAQQYGDALREFSSLARKLGRGGGGNFFYEVVRPLVRDLREAGRDKDAQNVLREARRQMTFEPDSILAREFKELSAPTTPTRQ